MFSSCRDQFNWFVVQISWLVSLYIVPKLLWKLTENMVKLAREKSFFNKKSAGKYYHIKKLAV